MGLCEVNVQTLPVDRHGSWQLGRKKPVLSLSSFRSIFKEAVPVRYVAGFYSVDEKIFRLAIAQGRSLKKIKIHFATSLNDLTATIVQCPSTEYKII